jgi:sterol desaturase/sphingolipid hydroxylase (fatty acid hydroxylase superfamily)
MTKAAIVLSALIGIMIFERLFPAARRIASDGLARIGRNLSLAAINALLSPFVVVPLTAYAASHALDWRPIWWNIALDILLLDLWIYWWHRANHEIRFLWRFHEIHHLDGFLDATTALRFHFGEVLLSALVRAAVIFALGVPLASVVVFETLLALATLFHHSNLRLPPAIERAISLAIVTPSIHWVHHHARQRDTDSNYATIFAWWDLVFRSRSPMQRTSEMVMGVEGQQERALADLVTRPFSPRR